MAAEPQRRGERATIGPSIFIKGDLTGDEDLVIEGRVEGKVDLKQNNVTIGRNGRVKADVYGQVVTIASSICHTFADYPEAYARACAEGGGGAPRN